MNITAKSMMEQLSTIRMDIIKNSIFASVEILEAELNKVPEEERYDFIGKKLYELRYDIFANTKELEENLEVFLETKEQEEFKKFQEITLKDYKAQLDTVLNSDVIQNLVQYELKKSHVDKFVEFESKPYFVLEKVETVEGDVCIIEKDNQITFVIKQENSVSLIDKKHMKHLVEDNEKRLIKQKEFLSKMSYT